MTHTQIQPGMILRLKKERQEAYGLTCRDFEVSSLKFRAGYKVPFVVVNEDLIFTPSDFAKDVTSA